MQQTLTAKLKLLTDPEEKAALREFSLAYRDACNYASNASFYQLNKSSSGTRIHDHVYRDLRKQYKLPSQIACSVSRNVAAQYKTQWTKLRQHLERQNLCKKKFRPYKGLDKPVHFVTRTCNYQYGRDWSFKRSGKVSVNTLDGRIRLDYQTYNKHLEMLRDADGVYQTKLGGATLSYEQKDQDLLSTREFYGERRRSGS